MTNPRRAEYGILSIPNRLFFDDAGLITLFNRYKFTVEENTPAEQEVALDPELLGKVFENLLAAYSSRKRRETARKQTGILLHAPSCGGLYGRRGPGCDTSVKSARPHDDNGRLRWQDRLRNLFEL